MNNAEILKNLFGVDASEIKECAPYEPDYPDVVRGRVLHIDGDFLAYQVSADDSKSVDYMKHNHDIALETLRLLAGAESTVLHLTDAAGDKGGRYDTALIKEYQGNRKNKVKPKHLYTIKEWMVREHGAISWMGQEADDGLCQATWDAIQAGTPDLAVLTSKDKDLQMCSGWHLNWDTGELEYVDGYGYVELDRSKSSPKVVGKGTAFFWAQMLMGDTADNISGVPTISGAVQDVIKPTKGKEPLSSEYLFNYDLPYKGKRKSGKCGAVATYSIMEHVQNDTEALRVVMNAYRAHGESEGFKHWDTGKTVTWQETFFSEANSLWMRRNPNAGDFRDFLKGL